MTTESPPKKNPFQGFFLSVMVKFITDDNVQKVIKDLLGQLITERILPLIPIAVGAATKAAVDELVERIPGIEGVVDVVQATDAARNTLNDLLPDFDFGIPALDNLLDIWRPKS